MGVYMPCEAFAEAQLCAGTVLRSHPVELPAGSGRGLANLAPALRVLVSPSCQGTLPIGEAS